jgi:pimeloyl-ACP methyl ester carboxylesterase
MRAFFAGFLLLHGLAHLVGFLVPWRLIPDSAGAPAPPMNRLLGGRLILGDVSARVLGGVWLIAALAFAVVSVAWWRQEPWSGEALVTIAVASLVLTTAWWPAARIGFALNIGILLVLAASTYTAYRSDIAVARSAAGSASTIAQTAAGPIEFAIAGTGDPVLSIHGTGGGWDQGLSAARGLVRFGYQVIAPSRFGYLGTPSPANDSPAAEADALAALADHLDIERATVISFSAGTAPALQFALRYPQRVNALILVVPAAGGIMPPAASGPPAWVMDVVLQFDFPMWFAIHHMPKTVANIVAVPHALVESLPPADLAQYDRAVTMLLPISARRKGLLMDARNQAGGEPVYPLEELTVPTLLVSANDDLYGTMTVARAAVKRIPGAELLGFPTGGHLLIGRDAELWPYVSDFMVAATEMGPVPWRPVH